MLEHLFRPLQIGNAQLASRIVSTAHQTTLARDHVATDDLLAYQAARARGGVGLIILEAAAIEPSGLVSDTMMGAYLPKSKEGFRRIGEAVHAYDTRIFAQLFHSGREVHAYPPKTVVVAPSAIPSPRYHAEPRALSTADVERIIESFATAAAAVAESGLDGIEVSAAHGYLGQQFFTPELNHRSDRFSEGPRFMLEVIEAIRAAAGGLPVGVRLSADAPAARAFAPHLASRVDFLHLAVGDSASYEDCVGIVPVPPAKLNLIGGLTEPFQLGPAIIATTRVLDPRDADRMVGEGKADAFGMNRALITDPDMPAKARAGRFADIIRCIACNACIESFHNDLPIRCAQNPRTGRELALDKPQPAARTQRVTVVGGGPAGLAAAAEAAASGHDVDLYEATDRLGGQVWLAGHSPMHAEMFNSMMSNYAHLLRLPNVTVHLGEELTADDVDSLDYDLLVVATGASPYRPEGLGNGVTVAQAWDVLAGDRPDGKIVIADWGGDAAGLDCADMLVAENRDVIFASGAITPGESLHQYTRNVRIGRLLRAEVDIRHYHGLETTGDGVLTFRNILAREQLTEIAADSVVLSLGRVPRDDLATDLRTRGVGFHEAGDCLSPRGIEEAILEGTMVVRDALSPSGVE